MTQMTLKPHPTKPAMIHLNGEPTGILLPTSEQPWSSDGYSGDYIVHFVPGIDYIASFHLFNKVTVSYRYGSKPVGSMSYIDWVSMNLAPHTRLYPFGKPQRFNIVFQRMVY